MWKKLHRSRESGDESAGRHLTVGGQPGLHSSHDTGRELPPLPGTRQTNHDNSSQPRIASSIYSRASTVVPQSHGYPGHDSQYTDVSPPVSPLQESHGGRGDSPDVSPIDETPPSFEQFHQTRVKKAPASALPVLRKPVKPGQAGSSTKWDDFSGEPTTDEKGKPALATPGHSPLHNVKPSGQKSQFSLLDKGRALNKAGKKLLESRRHHSSDDPAAPPPPREPWRGLSGRTALVEPVATDRSARKQPLSPTPRKDSLPQHMRAASSHSPESSATDARSGNKRTIIPVPPKDDVRSSPRNLGPDMNKPLPVKKPDENHAPVPEPFMSNFQDFALHNQPASRFSTTTYATTEAGSPPSSPNRTTAADAPPLPALPSETASRVRAAVRKPLSSEPTNVKVLPRSPEETGAGSRIEGLKAQINDLSRRRGNIDTIIHELTQVVQPSSIAYDLATRGEVKKTVESLNKELAEIKKEEHELGMKLMRAYKKQDQEDYYGKTSAIWIKRVAS